MEIIRIAYLFILTLILILGVTVLAHDPKKRINQLFFLITLAFLFWIAANFLIDNTPAGEYTIIWGKLAMFGPTFMPLLFVYFFALFPKSNKETRKIELVAILIFAVFSIIETALLPTRYNIASVNLDASSPQFKLGHLYILETFSNISSVFFCGYLLFKKRRILNREEKKQVILLVTGIAITVFFAITGVFLVFLNIFAFASIGSLFSVFVIALTAYAIIRYSLFNINLLAAEVFLLIILSLLSGAIVTSPDNYELAIRSALFILVAIMGYFLLRNIVLERERKRQIEILAQELEKTNKELKEFEKLRDDFMHIAIHEINTPMASILGYLSLILDEKMTNVDKKAERYLKIVYASSKRLAGIVADFLDNIKMEGGKIKLKIIKTNLGEILEEISFEYREKAKKRGNEIRLDFFPEKENLIIEADKNMLKEALINIVDNAVKSTERGKIKISLKEGVDSFVIMISDTGIGIPEDKKEKIFEKFYQLERQKNISPSGSGIGLYMSKMIIDLHKGLIFVESELGRGTVFFITLPKSQ